MVMEGSGNRIRCIGSSTRCSSCRRSSSSSNSSGGVGGTVVVELVVEAASGLKATTCYVLL